MTFSYENQVLRPAVLALLGEQPDVLVHVAPVEALTVSGRKRSAAELGKGTPDLLLSVRWRALGPMSGTAGAQWLAMELKAPGCSWPDGTFVCPRCCCPCTDGLRTPCCRVVARMVPRWSRGSVSPEQRNEHALWEAAGRWVSIIRTPGEALAALEQARRRLRAAGLEPCAVEGRR